jgi:crotonobetainyl-CoA:carnitine CoA-transferase CaiB-like acyl-CoA transferase
MLAQSGRSGELPTPVANSVIDAMTALYNVVGILAALVGRGKAIDVGEIQVSMLEAAIAIQCQEISAHINLNQRFERSSSGLAAPWNDAPYGVYETQRGSIAIAMADLALLGKILEVPELNLIASTGDTFSQRDRARVVLQEAALVFRRDDLVDLLLQHDVWCAPVLGFEEVTELEQVADSGILKTLHHEIYGSFVTPGLPVGFSNFEPSYEAAPPLPGEHTDEILRELGLSDAEIQDLKAGKYISSPKSSEDA